jgi:hypothetical protein
VPTGSPCEEHLDLILRLREIGADLGAAALPAFELLAVDLPHVPSLRLRRFPLPLACPLVRCAEVGRV